MAEGEGFFKRYCLILFFIAVAAVLAGALNFAGAAFGIRPEWRLAAFAVCVVVQAFLFGHSKGQLDGNRADLVYYLLGALGIVLLFFDAGTERLRIGLAGDYAIATANRDAFQQKRSELERVLGGVEALLQKFREAARAPETIARREKALKDCESLQVEQAKENMRRQFAKCSAAFSRCRSFPDHHRLTARRGSTTGCCRQSTAARSSRPPRICRSSRT